MEQGLRDCCRSIRIGKILIQTDEETMKAKVYYAKFPPDIYRRKILLMYPILSKFRMKKKSKYVTVVCKSLCSPMGFECKKKYVCL